MADRLYRAQVTIPLDSGVPEDAIVNTWHFDDDDDPIAGPEDTMDWIMSALETFYDSIGGSILASSMADTATVRMYDLRDAEPRVPRDIRTFSLAHAFSPPIVSEAALCLSFAAAPASGVNPARRRGRIYLGPIAAAAAVVEGSYVRPTDAARTAVANAAAVLVDGVSHPGSPGLHLKWAIYSPTTDQTSTIDDAFNDVVSGWIDNAFDTQRRRGPKPTSRVTFS